MTAQPFILRPENAPARIRAAWEFAKQILQHGKSAKVTVEECEPTRTLEQNALLHLICGRLAKQLPWCGKLRDTDDWKRLLVDAWARAEGKQQCEVVPSLDGQGVVNLGIQTRRMRVASMADLITFAQSYCVEHEVDLSDERIERARAA